ncbi:unnamed protein product [Closterium sp. Naga37s-1]|nr:unnamed protein product [Closterium sp. Naga37s-1]
MRDAFLTACGHSFCYSCITTHLHHKRNCPCCSQFLTLDQIFPNFTLNKLLKKATATQMVSTASPSQHLRLALQHGADVSMSVRELDALLALLAEKRRKAEQEEAEMNMDILLDFLQRSRQKKQAELDELRADLLFIREDIAAVEQRRRSLQQMREQSAAAIHALLFRGGASSAGAGDETGFGSGGLAGLKAGAGEGVLPAPPPPGSALTQTSHSFDDLHECYLHHRRQAARSAPSLTLLYSSPPLPTPHLLLQFDDLQECYLHHRRQAAHAAKPAGGAAGGASAAAEAGRRGNGSAAAAAAEGGAVGQVDLGMGLEDFRQVLAAFTRFRRVKVVAELRQGDLFHSSNIVSSIEFDRDDEFFATAGVSRRIKVFNFSQVGHGCVEFDRDDEFFATAGVSRRIKVFNFSQRSRLSRVKVVAELRQGDLFHSSNIVSSIEFDRDDEFFATAGVSRRIKVFNFSQVRGLGGGGSFSLHAVQPCEDVHCPVVSPHSSGGGRASRRALPSREDAHSIQAELPVVVGELADVHCPVVEMPTRSKLSCLSWNPYLKAHIASSEYEGIVTAWDVGASSVNPSQTRLIDSPLPPRPTIQVVGELADVHCPVVEMPTRSKLSCLSCNPYLNAHIASRAQFLLPRRGRVGGCSLSCSGDAHSIKAQLPVVEPLPQVKAHIAPFPLPHSPVSLLQVVGELADVHCPVVEMPTRSKLSCLSWNPYLKAHIASSDYEGIVTVWDVGTGQSLLEYEEHEKRAWSVDFARTEPTRLVSGSDDGKVKIWCTRQESSVLNIDMKANICCVKFNPGSANFIAVGSADHHIHYYDIRAPALPLHVFSGHRKAVSYVKFLSPSQLASASTDSTLRLWDVHSHAAIRTLRGHTNEKNFVGLSVNSDYIACGSETNEVYIYYKAMSKPMAVH